MSAPDKPALPIRLGRLRWPLVWRATLDRVRLELTAASAENQELRLALQQVHFELRRYRFALVAKGVEIPSRGSPQSGPAPRAIAGERRD